MSLPGRGWPFDQNFELKQGWATFVTLLQARLGKAAMTNDRTHRDYASDSTLSDRVFELLETWFPGIAGPRRIALSLAALRGDLEISGSVFDFDVTARSINIISTALPTGTFDGARDRSMIAVTMSLNTIVL